MAGEENFFTFNELGTAVIVVLGCLTALKIILDFVQAIKLAKKPLDDQKKELEIRLTTDEARIASNRNEVESLEARMIEVEKCNRLLLKSMTQLMTHEIDGNHVDKLREVRDEVEDYLINK